MPIDRALAERLAALTRDLRRAEAARVDGLEARRDSLLERADAELLVREDRDRTVVVVFPRTWMDGDTVDPDRIDPEEAVELPLEVDREEADWAAVDRHNRAVADAVAKRHGPVHGRTARAFGTYLANHHLKRVDESTDAEVRHFKEGYFPRNAWPSREQLALLERSLTFTRDIAAEMS